MRHPDPHLQWFARKLSRAQSEIGQITVSKGPKTNPRIAHLIIERKIEFEIPELGSLGDIFGIENGGQRALTAKFEVYLSKSAVTLTKLADDLKPEGGVKAIIFVEVEDPQNTDLTSGRHFSILRETGYALGTFRSDTGFLSGILGRALGVNRDGYNDMVEAAFADKDDSSVLFFGFDDLINAATLLLIDTLTPLVTKITKVFTDGTMPHELWDPDSMPKDFRELISSLGGKLDKKSAAVLQELASLPRLALAQEITGWPGSGAISGLLVQIERAEGLWNDALDFVTDVVQFVRQNIPKSEDVIGTTIGFLCGLWDGVIQAAAGIFETIQLVMTLLKGTIHAQQNPVVVGRFVLEAFDEIMQILLRVKWKEVWEMIEEEIAPKLIELFEASLDSLADTVARSPATVGYYAGFVVYNIAETFFPPLKMVGTARAVKAANEVAGFSRKVLPT